MTARPPRVVTVTRPALWLALAVVAANVVGCGSFSGPETKYLPAPAPPVVLASPPANSTLGPPVNARSTSTSTRPASTRSARVYTRNAS